MKHIKKKFQFEKQLTQDDLASMQQTGKLLAYSTNAKSKVPTGSQCHLITENDKSILAFQVNLDGKRFFIPEPDPILIYFNSAYANFKHIKEYKSKLISTLDQGIITESTLNSLYNYFSLTNGFVIFIFTAIEASINRCIPENFVYSVPRSNRTESYNKEQIQRHLSFDDKLNKVLTEISGKTFSKSHPLKYQHIINLKEFRDLIIHTKDSSEGTATYDYIYKKTLSFKHEETLHATRDLLNFYQPNYIEECSCGNDF
jgi:recombinational DNA repair protein RecR